jgi:hypothetical protein
MSTENKRKPRRTSGMVASQTRAASTMAATLALILVELQQMRREQKERDAYCESVGVPMRPIVES